MIRKSVAGRIGPLVLALTLCLQITHVDIWATDSTPQEDTATEMQVDEESVSEESPDVEEGLNNEDNAKVEEGLADEADSEANEDALASDSDAYDETDDVAAGAQDADEDEAQVVETLNVGALGAGLSTGVKR